MTEPEFDEGQFVAELIEGSGERPRSTAPEPALLPHMAARLCHDFDMVDVLGVAFEFGMRGNDAPPWIPLWEATLWGVTSRPDMVAHLKQFGSAPPDLLDVLVTLHEQDEDRARTLREQTLDLGADYPVTAGPARLAPLLPAAAVSNMLGSVEFTPGMLDAESARSLMQAAHRHGLGLSEEWLADALDGSHGFEYPPSRLVHLLPALPAALRVQHADELAAQTVIEFLPDDRRALAVSRIAPFVSAPGVWDRERLLDGLEPIWRSHIEWLLDASWPTSPWADVFRAHPEFRRIAQVQRAHETTSGAPRRVHDRWDSPPEQAAAGPDDGSPPDTAGTRGGPGDGAGSAPPPPPPSPAPGPIAPPAPQPEPAQATPRRLQADVLHDDSMQDVRAFVAGQAHRVDVSIGRGARLRAEDGPDVEEVFNDIDDDAVILPVWFHVGSKKMTGKMRLPRDPSRNSSVASFMFDAPPSGRVVARIHVLRPGGGMLLQSAMLIGDVVATLDASLGHTPDLQLIVDVVAGDLSDPSASDGGQTVIANEAAAVTERDGAVVEIDVSQLHDELTTLVQDIETAAEQQDVNPNAVGRRLVKLAFAGQRLRAQFEPQLGDLVDANPLQIVSLRGGDVLPLELLYSGPALSSTSKICPTWQQALQAGSCGGCAGGGPDNDVAPARVCPMRFWAMHKVIERRTADARGGPFRVSAERSASRPSLRPFAAVVFAASSRVAPNDVEALAESARHDWKLPASVAANWPQWRDAIDATHPELLVAMPHNNLVADGATSALMLGEPADDSIPAPVESELLAGGVTAAYVQTSKDIPGPVALLLGCNTQFEGPKMSSFAGEFREKGAALTIATLGELLNNEAPHAARVLIDSLLDTGNAERRIGERLLNARRQLLADGMIMALLLIANGDAQWLLPDT